MKKWEKAYDDYKQGMKYKDIASKYDVSMNTVKSWKSRYWNDIINNKGAPDNKKGCTQNKKVAHKEKLQPIIENDDLTEQQKMFCLFYLQHFNATKAYQQVYKCAYNTARTEGSKLLANPNINKELHRLKAELQQDIHVTTQDLMKEYIKQAFADINDVITSDRKKYKALDATGKPLKDQHGNQVYHYYNTITAKNSDEFDGSLVKEITQGRDGVSVKLYDKQKAMAELLKYYDKLNEDDKQSRRVVITRPKRGDSTD